MGNCIAPPSSAALAGKKPPVIWSEVSASPGMTMSTVSGDSSKQMSDSVRQKSLHKTMTREMKNRDVYKYYEIVEVLGVGSMGSVATVRKKKEAIGGSARFSQRRAQGCFGFGFKVPSSRSNNSANGDVSLQSSQHNLPSDRFYEVKYALKTIHLNRITDPGFIDELRNEIEILESLDHPNIVRAIETFEFQNQICIVMELCSGGDLYSRDPYTEAQAQHMVRNITSAVAYMHRCGITHRDLKYENIVFESHHPDAEIKIIDYGLSKKFSPDGPHMHDSVGTIYSMAPEVLEGDYDSQADLWSIGVIAFMLLSSTMPFHGQKRKQVFEGILNCHYQFSSPRWKRTSDQSRDFVSALIVKDPSVRLTAEQALQHPWLDADFKRQEESFDDVSMQEIKGCLERYANYSKLKKLGLLVVAHKSTCTEIGGLRDAFEKFDLLRNGTVCFDEFKEVLKDSGYSKEDLERIFKSIDLDGSGLIHYTEFLAATLEARGVIVEQRLAEAFDRLDSDDSGYISKQNLREFLQDGFLGRALTDEYLTEIIDECDTSKDGMVSYDEFLALWDKVEDMKSQRESLRPQSSRSLNQLNSLSFGF